MTQFAFFADWWGEQALSIQIFWSIGFFALILIVLQAALGIFIGHHGDVSFDGEHDGGNYFSLKTISAMLLGLGFGGVYCMQQGFSVPVSAVIGLVIGFVIAVLYLFLMSGIYSLRSDGNSILKEAIGQNGTVYMRIPAHGNGTGEIQVSFGGLMKNIRAYTEGDELPTGTAVRVTALRGENALVVEKI